MTGPANPPAPSGALARRFDQMFPVLTSGEITKVRSYGDVRRFQPGELLARVGRPSPGMYVILSGRLSVVSRDPLGRTQPVAEFGRIDSLINSAFAHGDFAPIEQLQMMRFKGEKWEMFGDVISGEAVTH